MRKEHLVLLVVVAVLVIGFIYTTSPNRYINRLTSNMRATIRSIITTTPSDKEGFENEGNGTTGGKKATLALFKDHVYGVFSNSREDFKNVRNAASEQLLTQVHQTNMRLLRHLQTKSPSDPRVKRFASRYNVKNITEIDPFNKNGDTSFVVAKGREIGLCVRQKNEERSLVDLNVIMYVDIHELAHIVSNKIGHGAEFQTNFRWLLEEAVAAGIPGLMVDYAKNPQPYCGISLYDSNPLI